MLEPTVRFKTCFSCKEPKTAAEFPPNKLSKDGLLHNCRQCQREQEAKTHRAQRFVTEPQVAEKECAKCHVVKDAKDFTPHIRSKGRTNYCTECKASQCLPLGKTWNRSLRSLHPAPCWAGEHGTGSSVAQCVQLALILPNHFLYPKVLGS